MTFKHFILIAALTPAAGFLTAKSGADDDDVASMALVAALSAAAGLLVREIHAGEDDEG